MKRLIASAVLLSAILVVPALFVGMSSTALATGTLKVTSPNGGESWTTGKKHVIKWAKGNGGTQVKIQLFKSNKHYKWISKKTKNDGKHVWKVPASVVTGSAYKIKITSVTKKTVSDASNKNFTITKSGGKPGGPTKLGPLISRYSGNEYLSGQRHLYAADLNGDGTDEVIFSGLIKNGSKFRVAVVDNKGKNVTTKYIRPNKISAEITQIFDLNGDGKDDVIFWGGTDSDYHVPSYVYLSKKKGPHTRKVITPKVWYHGAGQGDVDGDGKDDFVGTGYGGKGKYVVSYKNNALLIRRLSYNGTKCCFDGLGTHGFHKGSDIAVGNFDADANIELIITDKSPEQDTMAVEVYKTDNNYIYVRDDTGIKLPTEYWETPTGKAKIRGYYNNVNAIGDLSHDVRLVPFDINNDGKLDLIRVSRPWQVDGKIDPVLDPYLWPHYGHLQMMISQGNGQFLDQTSKYLKRWNIKLNAPYDFKFVDINKDGLTDIFYTYQDTWAKNDGTLNGTAANGFLINTGTGFKNYGNSWLKKQTKRAITASKKKFEYQETNTIAPFALGNFDSDSDLEVSSCAFGGNDAGGELKSYCRFWFSDITIKFPKYKAKKTSQLNAKSESDGFHVIKEKSGKQIYTDQPWKYLD